MLNKCSGTLNSGLQGQGLCMLFSFDIMNIYYTVKKTQGILTLPSRFGRGLARPAISPSCLCFQRHSAGFFGSLENAGLRTETRHHSNNLHAPEFFYFFMNEDTLMRVHI